MAAQMTALKDRFELEMAAMQIQVATLTAAVARCAAVLTDDAGSKVDSLDGISHSDVRAPRHRILDVVHPPSPFWQTPPLFARPITQVTLCTGRTDVKQYPCGMPGE